MSHLSCSVVSWMQLFSALSALFAAVLWFASAFVKMPSTYIAEIRISDLKNISSSFRCQSFWNACAAVCAAFAAVLQAALVYTPTCLNLG